MRISPEYVAGLFDGEGTIGLYVRRRPGSSKVYYQVLVQITMTRGREILEAVGDLVGGWVYFVGAKRAGCQDLTAWKLGGAAGVTRFLDVVGPYLILKARHAELARLLCDDMIRTNGRPLTPEDHARRGLWVAEVKALNRRGRAN